MKVAFETAECIQVAIERPRAAESANNTLETQKTDLRASLLQLSGSDLLAYGQFLLK